jgi:hypothetical protein
LVTVHLLRRLTGPVPPIPSNVSAGARVVLAVCAMSAMVKVVVAVRTARKMVQLLFQQARLIT